MSLGGLTRGVTPLELASAYGVLANQGIRVEPTAISKIVDRNGRVLEQNTPHEKVVVNERSVYLLVDMMKGVLTNGTGTAANIGRPAAGKTGTTSDYKDAWFVGFTPDLAAAVWMGNDNNGYLNEITGGTIPAEIWHDFMREALAKTPAHDFARPSGIISATVSTKDGLLADPKNKDAHNEIFIEGTQPTKQSTNKDDKKTDTSQTGKTLPPPPTKNDKQENNQNTATTPPPPVRPDTSRKN
jgi:penicillin-binding protein 1A